MATKSLYEMEDVCATLMYALEVKNHTLVFQAARELRVSGEKDLLINLVTMAWLLCDPHTIPMPLTRAPSHDTVFDDLCLMVDHYPSHPPKHKSVLPLPLPPSAQSAHDAVDFCISHRCWKPCLRMLITFLHKDTALLRAVLRDQCHVNNHMLEVLDGIVYQPLAERLLYHVVIQTVLLPPPPSSTTVISARHRTRYAAIWDSTTQGRAARTFQIPTEALSTWNIRPKTCERLQGTLIPCAVMDTTGRSLYWESTNPPPAEDDIEAWFAEHFPDDIPDEWSRTEIEKSHVYAPSMPTTARCCVVSAWHPAFLLCWA